MRENTNPRIQPLISATTEELTVSTSAEETGKRRGLIDPNKQARPDKRRRRVNNELKPSTPARWKKLRHSAITPECRRKKEEPTNRD